MAPCVGKNLSFQGTIGAELREFNHPIFATKKTFHITQEESDKISKEVVRVKDVQPCS